MTAHGATPTSLRLERLDSTRIVRALVLSLVLHLLTWGGYSVGKKYHVWEKLGLPAWFQKLTPAFLKKPKAENKPPTTEAEPPLMFVNVNPDTATPEPPEQAKFYSSLNSKAANPEPNRDTDTPKLTGKQEFVPETENVDRTKYDKLQPAAPPQQPQEEEKPKPREAPGDLAMARPELNPIPTPGTAERERPRRLSQVDPIKGGRPPSQMMKQDGGVRRQLDSPSLDTKSTVTGMYDWLFIQSVKDRWFTLMEDRDFGSARGHVRLKFKLYYDGRITEMQVLEHTVTETLSVICQKAVLDPAPFDKWTREMRLMIGKDFREITFTFYYY